MGINSNSAVKTKIVYDKLSEDYSSNKHNTVKFMVAVENLKIAQAVAIYSAYQLKKDISNIKILNIGVGNGLHRYMLTDYLTGPLGRAVADNHFIDFDISKKMLCAAEENYRFTTNGADGLEDGSDWKLMFNEESHDYIPRIQGNAVSLPFKEGAFDVVIAGLCDHIMPQNKLYSESLRILKSKGMFVVTYPNKELMNAIREEIYHIRKTRTRFNIDGRYYSLNSTPKNSNQIKILFTNNGFDSSLEYELNETDAIYIDNDGPSDTTARAAHILGRSLSNLAIVNLGVGFKGIKIPVKKFDLMDQNQLSTLEDMIYYYNPKPEKVWKYGLKYAL